MNTKYAPRSIGTDHSRLLRNLTAIRGRPHRLQQLSSATNPSGSFPFVLSYQVLLLMISLPVMLFVLTLVFRSVTRRKQQYNTSIYRTHSVSRRSFQSATELNSLDDPHSNLIELEDEVTLVEVPSASRSIRSQSKPNISPRKDSSDETSMNMCMEPLALDDGVSLSTTITNPDSSNSSTFSIPPLEEIERMHERWSELIARNRPPTPPSSPDPKPETNIYLKEFETRDRPFYRRKRFRTRKASVPTASESNCTSESGMSTESENDCAMKSMMSLEGKGNCISESKISMGSELSCL